MVLARYWTQKSPRRHQTTLQHLQQDLIPKLKLLRPRSWRSWKSNFFFFSVNVDLLSGEEKETEHRWWPRLQRPWTEAPKLLRCSWESWAWSGAWRCRAHLLSDGISYLFFCSRIFYMRCIPLHGSEQRRAGMQMRQKNDCMAVGVAFWHWHQSEGFTDGNQESLCPCLLLLEDRIARPSLQFGFSF